jgi:signal transduction histidine kinase/CheY-like chemotaxis protein
MTGSQRILHLEDSPEDAELIAMLLGQEGLAGDLVWVTTRQAFVVALAEPWDLILADYSLPGIRGRQALELALEHCPEVPFIYISGTMGEVTAIDCLHHGAADYILKKGLKRLAPAVLRALAAGTERCALRQAEAALRVAEAARDELLAEQRELLAATSAAGVVPWSRDPGDGSFLMGSGAEAVVGWPPEHFRQPGFALTSLVHPEDWQAFHDALARADAGDLCTLDLRVIAGGNRPLWTRWTFSSTGGRLHGAVRDVNEPHHLLDMLLQSQKLESMGAMAAGVAHDVNNLLTVLCLQMARIEAGQPVAGSQTSPFLVMAQAVERVKDLVRGLLSFARKKAPRREPVDLNRLVLEAQGLLAATLGPNVALETALEPSLPLLLLDEGQINQVLMNLVINATDAMAEGGTIRVSTRATQRSVVLEVADNGLGIPSELVPRIFEPFFTTKAEGKGTGLGLAVVYGIVTAHGGTIQCLSTPGQGTGFLMKFPVQAGGSPRPGAPAAISR